MGERRLVVAEGIIPRSHGVIDAHLQVSQMAERVHDPPTHLLDHVGDIRVGRGLDREKPWFETLLGATQIDTLQKNDMKVQIQIDATAEALDKRDRSWLHFMPFSAMCDGLIDLILRDGTADHGMHLRCQVT